MNWVNAVVQGILLGGLYALFACGLSILFGVVRVVNLAHVDFAVLAAYLALVIITIRFRPSRPADTEFAALTRTFRLMMRNSS